MSATLNSLRTYASRNGEPATLRDVAREQGALLRAAFNSTTIADNRTKAASKAPATVQRVRTADDGPRLTFAEVDALAKQVPAGRYALPKRNPTADNDVTFFEVAELRNGAHVIRMLVGAPGAFQAHPMKLRMQWFAYTHLLEGLEDAAVLFGRKTRRCYKCNSPLTNRISRDAGIGPDCRKAVAGR